MILREILTESWSRSGEGFERVWRLGRLPLYAYKRTEDQRWSPHYTERRTELGLRVGFGAGAGGTSFTNQRARSIALVSFRHIFKERRV